MASAEEVQKLLAALGGDPYGQALYNAANQGASVAKQNTMEDLAARGILNSTVTGDRVAQINADSMSQLLPKLFSYKQQKDSEAEEKRRYQEQMDLKRQELANSVSQFNQQMALRRAEFDANNQTTANNQAIWNDIGTQMQRRSHFKDNRDFIAQLQREGIDRRLGGEGWNALLTRTQNEWTGTDANGNPIDNVRGSLYNGYINRSNYNYPQRPSGLRGNGGMSRYYGTRNTKKNWGW